MGRSIFWSAFFLPLIPAAYSQTTASISGTVLDAANALVPGAKITLINEASKGIRVATSNGDGYFNFSAVQAATYSLRVVSAGFETWTVTGIEVHPGDSLTIPKIKLKLGEVTESVTVTAEAAGVSLNSGEHSTMITSADISRLSTTGRDVGELVSMLPGFTVNAGTDVQNGGAGGLYGYSTVTIGGAGGGTTTAGLGNYGANGAAPQQGLVNITSDGANVIDPGDMGGTITTVNMDQLQEVKVQTSNFGADVAKGPIVINAVGKSGSDTYHGGVYTYFRNAALNSNDWLGKYYGLTRPENQYFYPGATIGGPAKIPGTSFNKKKQLVFWAGFEYYGQNQSAGMASAFVPNAAMLAGDLSPTTIATALNVDPTELQANCATDYGVSSLYNTVAGICWSPDKVIDQHGTTVSGGNIGKTGSNSIDPASLVLASYYPAINRIPQAQVVNGKTISASDGINYAKNVMQTHNGYQFHTRVDENISDTLKLYGTYNFESINDTNAMNNIYYNPTGTVPYPTPMMTYMKAQYLTLNLTKTIGSSLTNELVATGVLFNSPAQFADPAKAQVPAGSAWESEGYDGGYFHNSFTQLPQVITYETVGIPSLSMSYVPSGSQYTKKFSWNLADNLTKQYRTHSIKAGYYMEKTADNSMTLGSKVNGFFPFMRWDACYQNQVVSGSPLAPPGQPTQKTGMGNTVGNLLIGCPLSYQQDNFDPALNLRFMTFEGYITDDWKVNSKLTVTFGIRLAHLQPWEDAHGIGMAIWDPSGMTQHTMYADSNDPKSWPGLNWHGRDPGIPNAGVPTRAAFYSPRVGAAYDLHGNGKTVFRGGWGAYHSHDSINFYGGSAAGTAVGLATYSTPPNFTCTFAQLSNFYGQPGQTSGSKTVGCGAYLSLGNAIPAFNVGAMDPKDDRGPVTYTYNFTVDQQGPWGTTFELAYMGNRSSNLSTLASNSVGSDLENQNVIPLNAYYGPDPILGSPNSGQTNPASAIPNASDYRPYPNYQHVDVPAHIAWSNYNGLQAGWNKQRGALTFGLNYTWSKALGVRGSYDTGYVSDPVNLHHDYGIVGFDRPHSLNAHYSYQEGKKYHGNRVLSQALNGWEISGITSLVSGADLAIVNGRTNFGLSGGGGYNVGTTSVSIPLTSDVWLGTPDYTLQPTVLCDPRKGLQKNQYVKGSCFGLPAQGTEGQWSLPDAHGPMYFKSDLSIYKNFTLSSRQNMQFRLSGFNFLNHPITSFNNTNLNNLYLTAGDPSGSAYTTPQQAYAGLSITNADSFGYTTYKNGVRIVELGFKYNF